MPACPNCHQEGVDSAYCPACGQRQGPLGLSTRQVLGDLGQFLFRVDGRFLRTLRGLLRPGFLTAEYLAGRRDSYERPLRLFAVLSAALIWAMPSTAVYIRDRTAASIPPGAPAEVAAHLQRYGAELGTLMGRFLNPLTLAYAVLLAVGLTIAYRGRGPTFAEHFVFAMHAVALLDLLELALAPVGYLSFDLYSAISAALFAGIVLLAQKRVHGQPWGATLWRWALAMTVTFTASVGVSTALGIYAYWKTA